MIGGEEMQMRIACSSAFVNCSLVLGRDAGIYRNPHLDTLTESPYGAKKGGQLAETPPPVLGIGVEGYGPYIEDASSRSPTSI